MKDHPEMMIERTGIVRDCKSGHMHLIIKQKIEGSKKTMRIIRVVLPDKTTKEFNVDDLVRENVPPF